MKWGSQLSHPQACCLFVFITYRVLQHPRPYTWGLWTYTRLQTTRIPGLWPYGSYNPVRLALIF